MYYIYDHLVVGNEHRFTSPAEGHLLGCNVGVIAKYLRNHTPASAGECGGWEMDMGRALRELEQADNKAFVIDLAPNDPSDIGLYELRKVWGWCESGFTPLMLQMIALLEAPRSEVDPANFTISGSQYGDPDIVHTFLYVRGPIRDGVLADTWTPPGPASTNGPILYPHVLEYFMSQVGFARVSAAAG